MAQKYVDRVVVCDDGSRDLTAERLIKVLARVGFRPVRRYVFALRLWKA